MAFTDKSITCSDCGQAFTFTAGEQESFQQRGFTNEPKRCNSCRQTRRNETSGSTSGGYNSGPRQMFSAVCAQCGKQAQVPFQPRGDRPVYCSDCFSKQPGYTSRR
ncbi:MAG: zinc-binding protein [Dehalococcoidia bacterium]|nr:zinc-binding protein [Dehalococcoidia bacterium]